MDRLSGSFPRRSLYALAWMFVVILGAIVVLEVGLRLVLGLGSPVLTLPDKGENAGGYGYSVAPDQNVYRFFARNKINHFGMRSEDVDISKEAGHIRLYFIGDSVTYGTTYIDQSRIFTSLVGQNLSKYIGRPVDILNASAGGWAPSNEIGFLKNKGTFNADIVLVVLNTSDLAQPFADFEPSLNYPTAKPLTAIGEAWTRYIAPRIFGSSGISSDPGSIPSLPLNVQEETTAVLSTLEEGRVYALKHNSNFGIVYVPSHSLIWDGPAFQHSKAMLTEWAVHKAVPLIDLSEEFGNRVFPNVYLGGGGEYIHLNTAGHEIVAAGLLKELPGILGVKFGQEPKS